MPTRRDHRGRRGQRPPGTPPSGDAAAASTRDHRGAEPPPRKKDQDLTGNAGGVSVTEQEEADLGKAAGGD